MDESPLVAAREAERIIWAAGWRLREEAVLGRLAGTGGDPRKAVSWPSWHSCLTRAGLEPRSDVIRLVDRAARPGRHQAARLANAP
jgi:hypothetical protein